ncbi:MAG: excinuclease ABC subunit UvrC [Bacteroidota bacterium]|nr:excinuclease ABC subunit UvrC [Bacteroidota bacterium]
MSERIDNIKSKVKLLPEAPGVYKYFDSANKIIYIGKAKNLKKRVASYFNKNYDNNKVRILVKQIIDIQYIVVDSESDALLLENNLIKKYQPKYNILLKDDKSFPWIVIKNEPFPRIFSTRTLIKDGSKYFGPYTSGYMVKILLDLIRQLYPLRTCKLNLSADNIRNKKYKTCLEYHIGNCKAPCVGKQSEQDYNKSIEEIKKILKGNIFELLGYLKQLMREYSEKYEFEDAQIVKNKIDILEKYKSKSTVVSPALNNIDVFSIINEENIAYVNFIKLVSGRIVQAYTVEMKKRLNESDKELLNFAIIDLREKFNSNAKEIIVPFEIDENIGDFKVLVPKIGDKKKLLDLSQRNLKYYRYEKHKRAEQKKQKYSSKRILETMKKDLRLSVLPTQIECFDNSNIQGTNPVASCVVFKNAKPSNKEYRHYNIKTVVGPDDFASMQEVVYRRYKRLLDEKKQLPQLIVVDGGKGQLSSAVKSLEKLKILNKIVIIGIAKRLEEIFFPGDPIPIYIDKNSETLKVIQHLRNEAHRFGINFHRDKRSQNFIKSELENINGIGQKTIEVLLTKYKSVEKIKLLKFSELKDIIGLNKAEIVFNYFNKD